MSFAKKSTDKEDVKQGGSSYITGSGIYPITILAPFVNTSEGGSSVVDLFLEHEGQQQVLYGNMRVTNNNDADGNEVPNKIGMKIFNQLLIIADKDEVADAIEGDLPIGKDQAEKTVAILEDLTDIDVLIRIQMEYSMWKNQIQERKNIKGFYRMEDNATAEEIVNETEAGKGFEKDQKYVNNVTYKDDLTPEDIEAWISNGRKSAKGASKKAAATKTPSFGKRRFAKKEA